MRAAIGYTTLVGGLAFGLYGLAHHAFGLDRQPSILASIAAVASLCIAAKVVNAISR
jgi:hypothetical protein